MSANKVFTLVMVILVVFILDLWLFSTVQSLLREPSDVSVAIGIVLILMTLVLNYVLGKIIYKKVSK